MTSGDQVVALYRRDGLHRDEQVRGVLVSIADELPRECGSQIYEDDAEALVNALWDALPGATIDRVLHRLMVRRASLMRVGYLSVGELALVDENRRGTDLVG